MTATAAHNTRPAPRLSTLLDRLVIDMRAAQARRKRAELLAARELAARIETDHEMWVAAGCPETEE